MKASKKLRSGDEWYTPQALVERIRDNFNIFGKKVYLPFDTKDSEFYKVLKQNNEVMLKQYVDFFSTPDSFLTKLHKEGWIIVSNPPFSVLRKIIVKLQWTGIKYYLLCCGNTVFNCIRGDRHSIYIFGDWKFNNQEKHLNTALVANDGLEIAKMLCYYTPKPKDDLYNRYIKRFSSISLQTLLARTGGELDLSNYRYSKDAFGGEYVIDNEKHKIQLGLFDE